MIYIVLLQVSLSYTMKENGLTGNRRFIIFSIRVIHDTMAKEGICYGYGNISIEN